MTDAPATAGQTILYDDNNLNITTAPDGTGWTCGFPFTTPFSEVVAKLNALDVPWQTCDMDIEVFTHPDINDDNAEPMLILNIWSV